MLYRRYLYPCIIRYLHTKNQLVPRESCDTQVLDTNSLHENDFTDLTLEKRSVLDECKEDISHVAPYLKPTFNFAAYVNKSKTLQELVNLGVSLHKLEKKSDLPLYILKLDFEKDLKNYIIFLSDLGVPNDEIGTFITKNPYIFKEDLESLEVRINYLKSKKFTSEMIARVVTKNPFWLNFSTQRIDQRLGFFQHNFFLSGNEVRTLTTKQPKLITYSINHVKLNTFSLQEEMGFTKEETKRILLNKPNIFMKRHENMLKTFEFVHRTMKIPIDRIVQFPEVLMCRLFRIKQRHLFLEKHGKAQYNPLEPNYVSLLALISGSDSDFCNELAKSSIQAFNAFLKSI